MILSKHDNILCRSTIIDQFEFKSVEQFKYLGTILNRKKGKNSCGK